MVLAGTLLYVRMMFHVILHNTLADADEMERYLRMKHVRDTVCAFTAR